MASSRWVVSSCDGERSDRTSSVTVVSVNSPGRRPLIASIVISVTPSGWRKSNTGSSFCWATSAM